MNLSVAKRFKSATDTIAESKNITIETWTMGGIDAGNNTFETLP
jgi:hypothetical protein